MSETVSLLKQAINLAEKIESLRSRLATAMQRVPARSGIGATVKTLKKAMRQAGSGRKKPKFSAAGRARIAAAQRRRWAKVRAEKGLGQSAKAVKKKATRKRGKLSAAGRAAIVAAQKKRWAKVRRGK